MNSGAESLELALLAVSLAVKVEASPLRERPSDHSVPVYPSSPKTLAGRMRQEVVESATCSASAQADAPAPFRWEIRLKVGAARRTVYTAWVRESPEQLREIVAVRQAAEALRRSLPHAQRKKKPWGVL